MIQNSYPGFLDSVEHIQNGPLMILLTFMAAILEGSVSAGDHWDHKSDLTSD